jgi:hypothetical protein
VKTSASYAMRVIRKRGQEAVSASLFIYASSRKPAKSQTSTAAAAAAAEHSVLVLGLGLVCVDVALDIHQTPPGEECAPVQRGTVRLGDSLLAGKSVVIDEARFLYHGLSSSDWLRDGRLFCLASGLEDP